MTSSASQVPNVFQIAALNDLFRHMQWADAEVWRTVLASADARNDATLRGLLLHLHVVQRAFLSLWIDAPPAFPDVSEFPDIEQLHAWAQPYYPEARAFLDHVEDEVLARPIVMPWAEDLAKQLGRPPQAPTLGETIFQVTSHSTYHRGQVNARLRAVGGEPALVDYIAWIWFGRPSSGSPMSVG